MFNRFIGVDVAKAKVDVFLSETGELMQIKNDEKSLHSPRFGRLRKTITG